MSTCETTEYLIIWEPRDEDPVGGLMRFQDPPNIDPQQFGKFRDALLDSRLWLVDTSQAITTNAITGEFHNAQVAADDLFICGFFVVRGPTHELLDRTRHVDMGFFERYRGNLSEAAMSDLIAHTTFTFAPVIGIEASLMVLWAKYLKDMPNIPVDLVMDVIVAYNHWGRKLYDEGVMLDTGRINVRFETSHFKDGIRHDGPKTSGRLIGLGARSINGPSVEEALEVSGIDRTRYIIEARKCNGWCRSAPDTPLYLFDPRNEIYV